MWPILRRAEQSHELHTIAESIVLNWLAFRQCRRIIPEVYFRNDDAYSTANVRKDYSRVISTFYSLVPWLKASLTGQMCLSGRTEVTRTARAFWRHLKDIWGKIGRLQDTLWKFVLSGNIFMSHLASNVTSRFACFDIFQATVMRAVFCLQTGSNLIRYACSEKILLSKLEKYE